MTVLALDGVIRRPEWGSTTLIQDLLGVGPDGRPAAELWFGAHPDDPSGVPAHGRTLDEVIAADPPAALGPAVVERFGPRLPFLLKILAADKALSMQVHPTGAQARAGFAAEDAAGIARTARERNYRDANHKPELLCALTPFEGLCGFRPVPATLALLEELDVAELGFVADLLAGPDPLRTAFTALLTHEDPATLVEALVARIGDAPPVGPLRAAGLAAHDFPGDIGAVLTLLLNYVRLEPAEAIYLGAGNVHCYLRGMGVEIMANSDNVLRCGLTPKHIDVAELVKITDFAELAEPRWPSTVRGRFDVPIPDFRLTRLELDKRIELHDLGPSIVLCTAGAAQVGDVPLPPGHAAFVPAALHTTLVGTATLFIAGVGGQLRTTADRPTR